MIKSSGFLILLVLAIVGSGLLLGCPVPTDTSITSTTIGDGTVTISGKLGTGLSVSRGGIGSRSIAGAVSHIAAIPVVASGPLIGQEQVSQINVDGSFSMQMAPQTGVSTLFLLINQDATTLEEKAVAFTSLLSTQGESLALFPMDLASRNLDFGTLNLQNGDAVSSKSLESQSDVFTMEFNNLLQIAFHDNSFKHVKNEYVNTHQDTGEEFHERTRCCFNTSISNSLNKWMDLDTWNHTSGFNMRIDVFYPKGYSYSDITSGIVDVEMVPPQTFTLAIYEPPIVLGPTNPILASMALRDDIRQASSPPWLTGPAQSGMDSYVLEFDGRENLTNGEWKMNLLRSGGRSELALFDLQAVSPFTAGGAFIYYYPKFKVSVDSSKKITAIDIVWYSWNPYMNEYERVLDFSTFNRIIPNYAVNIAYNQTNSEGIVRDNGETFSDNPQHCKLVNDWYVDNTINTDAIVLDWMRVVYSIAGVEYMFTLYP